MFLGYCSYSVFTTYATCNGISLVVIVDLITLLSIYLLGNLRLFKTVGGIRLSQEKEIHPILCYQGACLRNLHTI